MSTVINGLAVSAQVFEPERNLVRMGRDDAAVFVRLAPATLAYLAATPGSPLYRDVLPALSQAVPVRRDGTATGFATVDLTQGRYVLFVKPTLGGTPTLLIASEPVYNYRVTRDYYIPLEIVHLHAWEKYPAIAGMTQPVAGDSANGGAYYGTLASQGAGGGASYGALTSQSAEGGASYGTFASQSLQGGGAFGGIVAQSIQGGAVYGDAPN